MKICIILREPYPRGMACSGRIHFYARGLIQQGHDVKIRIPLPLDLPGQILNPNRAGMFEGVPYTYSWKTTVRSKSFLGRRFHDFFGPLGAAFHCVKVPSNLILLVSNSTYLIFLFRLVAWLVGAKYIIEKSELPFFNKESLNLWQRLYTHFIYKSFDGMIVISNSLAHYFEKKLRRKAPLLRLPIIVDVDQIYNPTMNREKTIAYTGTLTQHKDGILTIIECFAKVSETYREYTLEMTGNLGRSPVRQEIIALVEKYQLQHRVRFLGVVDWKTLLVVLNRAGVLVLAKPYSRQASACFPTKLGGYLATGNPVLVTRVGEISQHLKDGITAFLTEPTVEAFTGRLHDVLSDTVNGRRVGRHGQEYARKNYDISCQIPRLCKFFEDICVEELRLYRGK